MLSFNIEEEVIIIHNGWTPKKKKMIASIYIYITQSRWMLYNLYISAACCLRQERTNKFVSLYLYVPDESSLLPKYRDCTMSNDFELYLMCCGVMLLLLIIYICNCCEEKVRFLCCFIGIWCFIYIIESIIGFHDSM